MTASHSPLTASTVPHAQWMPKEHNECTSHLSLSHSPTPLFLISRAKAPEATAHPPHRVPSPRKHTPRTECPKLGHLPRLRRLSRRRCASPDQSVEHVVGVTVLAAGHPNRRRRSGRRSSPPKQHQANVLRLQARLDPIEVRLKPIEPTHSAPPERRRPLPLFGHPPPPANPPAPFAP
ncbi:hypothetical protein DAI22_07g128150 [Oryza sativa Japonica Group]|nr:hypothetical protein DAI22_07g128150 [Oryza sativa Japonica Group]